MLTAVLRGLFFISACVLLGCGDDTVQSSPSRDAYVYNVLDNGTGAAPRSDFRLPPRDIGNTDTEVVADMAPLRPLDQGVDHDGTLNDIGFPVEDAGPAVDQMPPDEPLIEDGRDTDGDGLDDGWERGAGDSSRLDWQTRDTDGDGVPDGSEDFDGDGLTALQEQAAGRLERISGGARPHPFLKDLLIEVDAMEARLPDSTVFKGVRDAYQDLSIFSDMGIEALNLHFYRDQTALPVRDFDGDFAPRQAMLSQEGPILADAPEAFPFSRLLHLIFAARRVDLDTRAGEVVTHNNDIERTGVLIYADTIESLFPRCGLEDPPPIPFVTQQEAMVTTLVHEIGHALQLGHDTELNGEINEWNVMSVATGCGGTRRRSHGEGNNDPIRGSTEAIGAPRFSLDAAELIQLDNVLSVDTSRLVDNDDGLEM